MKIFPEKYLNIFYIIMLLFATAWLIECLVHFSEERIRELILYLCFVVFDLVVFLRIKAFEISEKGVVLFRYWLFFVKKVELKKEDIKCVSIEYFRGGSLSVFYKENEKLKSFWAYGVDKLLPVFANYHPTLQYYMVKGLDKKRPYDSAWQKYFNVMNVEYLENYNELKEILRKN